MVRPITRGAVGRLDRDARQPRGGGDQRVQRQVDAGRDDAAFIGARIIDHVEGGGGAEIDDDQIAFVERVGGDGVEHPVGADRFGLGDVELDPPFGRRLAGDERLDAEIFGGEHFEIVKRARHHRADDHRLDVGLGEAFEREQLVQPDRILIGGPPRIGRDPPARADHAVLDQSEDQVGVAGVDGEQHGERS